ncbi:S1-like domain-containing RNA-binding protein [uncultured Helicobacter sp.]|uniref:S1-like domain-containing RNA-binding protein n=1 Tax=uncultured Helicobacter sp. TaxID=175537 RepID=UPI001C39F066|nr:hypothetical protein [Candidatus Helicobacter avicola]
MVGTLQNLKIIRFSQYGAFLQGEIQGKEILLPKKFVDSAMRIGESVRVFVAYDSEDRIVATTQIPKLLLGEIGALEVVDSNEYGYFADLGVDKHLFIPHKSPKRTMIGQKLVVFLTLDKQGRLIGKLGVKERLRPCRDKHLLGREVDALVFERTPLGFGCVVDALDLKTAGVSALDSEMSKRQVQECAHYGLLYASEVVCTPHVGERIAVRIKHIRNDGKLDLSVVAQGESGLLKALLRHNGRVEIDFKSSPQEIASLLGMSKKNFKTLANKLVREGKVRFVESDVRGGHKALALV